jgi:NitT/TauT family transport system ATP-binding protein
MFQLKNIYKSFGTLKIFEDFSIDFKKNKINCILGPSGCGKTTLLNIIAGLVPIDSGELSGINREKISCVFQEPRLLPWKTAWKNIEFTLRDKIPYDEVGKIVDKYIKLVKLDEYRDYYPGQLSGGMNQRVSLARAFSFPSELILMDEPFKGLDYKLKQSLQNAFLELWQSDNRTVIYVTHDVDEAIELGENIFLFSRQPVKILKSIGNDQIKANGKIKQMIIELLE